MPKRLSASSIGRTGYLESLDLILCSNNTDYVEQYPHLSNIMCETQSDSECVLPRHNQFLAQKWITCCANFLKRKWSFGKLNLA